MIEMGLKTIRAVLRPTKVQYSFLMQKAKSIPDELRPKYEAGNYPKGCARIVNGAIQKEWATCRKMKQIPLDKSISEIVKQDGVLWLKFQTVYIPIRVKLIAKLDDLLLNHYNSAVVWLRGVKWVADIQVNIEDKYIAGQPEAIVGIDLNKEHTAYSIWIGGKEIYRAFDKLGFYYNTMLRLEKRIADVQANFEGNRKELSGIVRPLYDARKMVLRQYYGTLRNKILLHVPEGYNTVFVVEDLEYLPRRELGKKQRKWACQQLANGVLYNSIDWNGYKIVKVDPRGTTHTCYKCSRKVSDGRGRTVICDKCYPKGIDRDLNGARNIALRYMLRANPQHSCSGDMVNESLELNTKEAIQN